MNWTSITSLLIGIGCLVAGGLEIRDKSIWFGSIGIILGILNLIAFVIGGWYG